jgi:subtilisin family serine protease
MPRISWRRGSILVVAALTLALGWGASAPPPATAADTRVELVRTGTDTDAHALLASLGGVVEVASGDRIQARVPAASLPTLRRAERLVRLDPSGIFVPLQALAPGTLVGADAWREGGLTGRGVRVAVLDTGFQGYQEAVGGALPATVIARSFRADGNVEGTSDHGRRAAEIIHSIAPGAQIYLLTFSTITEMSAAVDYLSAEGVTVVSFSIGYIHNGPGDGTGSVNGVVSRSVGRDTAWAVASGNWAQQHWAGTFRDENRDAIHEFRPGVQQIGHYFNGGDLISLSLRWDDTWGAACADYDLELFAPSGALIRASRQLQDCGGNPVEAMQVLATEPGVYFARVIRGNAASPRALDLIFVGSPDRGAPVTLPVLGGSLGSPADHPDVLTVGALTNALVRSEAPYSSRGPTVDGRPKPELLAPTGISAGGSETFAGTSAAAPHVAAAMALLREAIPGVSRARLIAELRTRGALLPLVEGSSPGARRLDLSSTAGIGPLLPPEAEQAALVGALREGETMASVRYHGPDGYPLRFLYRLAGEREVLGAWTFDGNTGRWHGFVMGGVNAPETPDRLSNGQGLVIVLR